MSQRAKRKKERERFVIVDVFPPPGDPQAIRDREAFVKFALQFRPRDVAASDSATTEAA